MNLRNYSILILLVFLSCNSKQSFDSQYYSKTNIDSLTSHLINIGFKQSDLKNTVFLISPSLSCSPFYAETKYWQENNDLYPEINFYLIILTEFKMSARAMVESENIFLPFKVDSTSIITSRNLLPELPVKVFFDENGSLKNISAMNGNIISFL